MGSPKTAHMARSLAHSHQIETEVISQCILLVLALRYYCSKVLACQLSACLSIWCLLVNLVLACQFGACLPVVLACQGGACLDPHAIAASAAPLQPMFTTSEGARGRSRGNEGIVFLKKTDACFPWSCVGGAGGRSMGRAWCTQTWLLPAVSSTLPA